MANLADIQLFYAAVIKVGAISPFMEMPDWLNKILSVLYGAEDLVSQKTAEALTLFMVFLAPVAIIVIIVLAKVAYDLFTGAADSVADSLLIIRYKVKSFIVSKFFPDR